jgi:LysM repeat protein
MSPWALTYVIKSGDTLSKIAQQHYGPPIYGSQGGIRKILADNPKISNPDRIYVGQRLELPGAGLLSAPQDVALAKGADRKPSQDTSLTPDWHVAPAPGHWGLAADFASSKIHSVDRSTGSSADIFSNSNFGLRALWSQQWSPTLSTTLSAGFRKWDLLQPRSVATLSETNPTIYDFGLDFKKRLSKNFSLLWGIGYSQELSLSGWDATTIAVDRVSIPTLKLGADVSVLRLDRYEFGLAGDLRSLLPGRAPGYSTRWGFEYSAGTYLRLPLRSKTLQAMISYDSIRIKTPSSSQDTGSVVFGFGLTWPLSDDPTPASGEAPHGS